MSTKAPTTKLGSSYYKLFAASAISNLGDGIGIIAYPWLASAITRNGFLIALVAVVQRLPWLFFSLPAGVITDRMDRRTLMVWSNWLRAALTLVVAVVVLARQGDLIGPNQLEAGVLINDDYLLYAIVIVATLLLGTAEVLYDNTAQTVMPSIVETPNLEKANGRLWSVEQTTNTFIGPPLGGLLLVVAFSVPFFVDAATFAVSAALISLIPARVGVGFPSSGVGAAGTSERAAAATGTPPSWRADVAEGIRWLMAHDLLRSLAIVLGVLNMLSMLATAALVLYAQEVLETSPTEFAILLTGGALGGIVAGWVASDVAKRLGSGPSLMLVLLGGFAISLVSGLTSWWPLVWVMFAVWMFTGTVWNVITVSLRQTIIPDRLLGRVNSVYRFFGWGMMPIGALLAGLTTVITESVSSRELALRMPWFLAAIGHLLLLPYAGPRLTTAKMDEARAAVDGAEADGAAGDETAVVEDSP